VTKDFFTFNFLYFTVNFSLLTTPERRLMTFPPHLTVPHVEFFSLCNKLQQRMISVEELKEFA
jgi:hypothetical protein